MKPKAKKKSRGNAAVREAVTSRAPVVLLDDCLSLLKTISSGAIDVCVTSPPYNIGMNYDSSNDRLSTEDYIDWSLSWMREALRVSKRGLWLNIGSSASRQSELFQLMGAVGREFSIQNTIVWAKSVHVDGVTRGHFKPINSEAFVNNTHEYIFQIVKEKQKIDRLSVGVPFSDTSNISRFGHTRNLRCNGSVWFVPYETKSAGHKAKSHPAAYPVELAKRMIRVSGATGVVLDPFLGSGTTGRAAVELGLPFVGCDVSEKYVNMATANLKSTKPSAKAAKKIWKEIPVHKHAASTSIAWRM